MPVLQVFGVENITSALQSGGNNVAVPIRKLVTIMNAESLKGKFFRKRNYIKIKDELPDSVLDFRRRYVFSIGVYIILIKHLDAY